MKKQIILSFVLLIGVLLAGQTVLAQASNKNQRQLHINSKSEVRNGQGTKLGYISKEDIVNDNESGKLGFVENGKVYNADGKPLGKAKKNGNYFKNRGENVITAKNNGEICEMLDPESHNLGTVHKNYKLHSCAKHCFYLKQVQIEN